MQSAWRYVFEGFNISMEHVADKTFHWIPGSKFVEEIHENYNQRAFFMQIFLNQITKLCFPTGGINVMR